MLLEKDPMLCTERRDQKLDSELFPHALDRQNFDNDPGHNDHN